MSPTILLLAAEAADGAPGGDSTLAMIGIAAFLVLVGVGLFFLEALFPSFGVLTIMGIACIAGSLIAAFGAGRLVGFVFIGIAALAIPASVLLAIAVLRSAGAVLETESGPRGDVLAAAAARPAPAPGTMGVALTPLRPSGTAVFDGRRVSVVTRGEMVEPEQQIEVVLVEGTRTVVRAVKTA